MTGFIFVWKSPTVLTSGFRRLPRPGLSHQHVERKGKHLTSGFKLKLSDSPGG